MVELLTVFYHELTRPDVESDHLHFTLATLQQDSHTYNYITRVLGKKDALHSIFRFS